MVRDPLRVRVRRGLLVRHRLSGGVVVNQPMNRTEAKAAHAARLRRLTNTQVRNLMEHAANKTPLLPVDEMVLYYVDPTTGRC